MSTKLPLAIHKEDRRRIFQSKTAQIQGTEFINNQKNVVKSINCDDVTVYTTQSKEVDVKIVHKIDWLVKKIKMLNLTNLSALLT